MCICLLHLVFFFTKKAGSFHYSWSCQFQWHLPLWVSVRFYSNSCRLMPKKKNTVDVLKIWTHLFCFFKMLINAVSAPEQFCKSSLRTPGKIGCTCMSNWASSLNKVICIIIVPELLYLAMIGSLRQQFYPRMRQAGRDRNISDSHRKAYSCPMCDYDSFLSAWWCMISWTEWRILTKFAWI